MILSPFEAVGKVNFFLPHNLFREILPTPLDFDKGLEFHNFYAFRRISTIKIG